MSKDMERREANAHKSIQTRLDAACKRLREVHEMLCDAEREYRLAREAFARERDTFGAGK
jgi:hypothetical protein